MSSSGEYIYVFILDMNVRSNHTSQPLIIRSNPSIKTHSINDHTAIQHHHRYPTLRRTLVGNDALIGFFVNRRINPYLNDYSLRIVAEEVIPAMRVTSPPTPPEGKVKEEAAEWILQNGSEYVGKVVEEFNQAVRESSGRTDTELGLRADHVDYR